MEQEELKIKLQHLQKKLDHFKQVKTTSDGTAQHIKVSYGLFLLKQHYM